MTSPTGWLLCLNHWPPAGGPVVEPLTWDLISKHGQLGLASEVSPVSTVPPGHREMKRLHPKLQAAGSCHALPL